MSWLSGWAQKGAAGCMHGWDWRTWLLQPSVLPAAPWQLGPRHWRRSQTCTVVLTVDGASPPWSLSNLGHQMPQRLSWDLGHAGCSACCWNPRNVDPHPVGL